MSKVRMKSLVIAGISITRSSSSGIIPACTITNDIIRSFLHLNFNRLLDNHVCIDTPCVSSLYSSDDVAM